VQEAVAGLRGEVAELRAGLGTMQADMMRQFEAKLSALLSPGSDAGQQQQGHKPNTNIGN
jgi:hypothetical protein